MNTIKNIQIIGVSLFILAGLTACNKPGPGETAGKKFDQVVEDANKKLDEKSEKMSAALDDSEVTTKVKAAIFAEPGLKSMQISVDTVKGVVTLSGSVDSQQSSDKAKSLASAVAGVKSVEDKLLVK
jgi:osmotically-inducible protein OsmY